MTRAFAATLLAALLAAAAPAQLDPAACQQARKDLAAVAKAAAFEHRVQSVDALVDLAFVLALSMSDAELGSFDDTSVDGLRNALEGWVWDQQDASLLAAGMVRDQLPAILSAAFGTAPMYGRLPPGFVPGDGGVLDDFRARLGRQQATLQRKVDKVLRKVEAWIRKRVDVDLVLQVVPPEVAWVAGDRDAALAALPEPAVLDVLVAAHSDTLALVGTRVALAGNAADASGALFVQLTDCALHQVDGLAVMPHEGRWSASFAGVTANPVIVRITRGGDVLAERCLGLP